MGGGPSRGDRRQESPVGGSPGATLCTPPAPDPTRVGPMGEGQASQGRPICPFTYTPRAFSAERSAKRPNSRRQQDEGDTDGSTPTLVCHSLSPRRLCATLHTPKQHMYRTGHRLSAPAISLTSSQWDCGKRVAAAYLPNLQSSRAWPA